MQDRITNSKIDSTQASDTLNDSPLDSQLDNVISNYDDDVDEDLYGDILPEINSTAEDNRVETDDDMYLFNPSVNNSKQSSDKDRSESGRSRKRKAEETCDKEGLKKIYRESQSSKKKDVKSNGR